MTSYQERSSCLISGLSSLCNVISSKMLLVSVIGMFEYTLEMSSEPNVEVDVIGGF